MLFVRSLILLVIAFFIVDCGSHSKTSVGDHLPGWADFIPPAPVDLGPIPEGTIAGELLSRMIAGKEYRFRWIPAGTFSMGTNNDPQRFFVRENGVDIEMEAPAHQVTISKGFWMLENEVTQDQWLSQMGTSPSNIKGGRLPVVNVQYVDIMGVKGFFDRLHTQTIRTAKFFLPTEAQWEYAYRAGTLTRYYWGDDDAGISLINYAWNVVNSNGTLHEVSTKLPNRWNLYDMSGNAYEIVEDYAAYYTNQTQVDPNGPISGNMRVYRGGSYKSDNANCRSTNRILDMQLVAYDNQSFRFIMLPDSYAE